VVTVHLEVYIKLSLTLSPFQSPHEKGAPFE